MNAAETALVNNPIRRAIQRRVESPMLLRFGGSVDGERVLEIGCGQGVGTEIILEQLGAAHVTACDLDPGMVDLARRRLAPFCDRVSLSVADAQHLEAPDDRFDAVFDFGIIHHIPDRKAAIAEVRRVLRPGGRFFFEEVITHALDRWSYRTFLDHPEHDRFGVATLVDSGEGEIGP